MNAIAVVEAKLPKVYERAKEALERCVELDECKEWKDKAAALASYAKQADDEELYKSAMKIKGRAVRRMGELLKEIPSAEGGDRGGGRPKAGEKPLPGKKAEVSRGAVAEAAGVSRSQMNLAIQVANVPEAKFEKLIESDEPPTVTELAAMGRKPRPKTYEALEGRDPAEFNASMRIQSRLSELAELMGEFTPGAVARGAKEHELPTMKVNLKTIQSWLKRLESELRKQSKKGKRK